MSWQGIFGAIAWPNGAIRSSLRSALGRARSAARGRMVELGAQARARFRAVPSPGGLLPGGLTSAVAPEDWMESLLDRDPVQIDLDSMGQQIEGQTILVTGAAGTIGSELCRQTLQFRPAKLICLDRNETGMFYLGMGLATCAAESEVVLCVTDSGDGERIKAILAEHRPDVIFHAAAYKHVPIMETNVYDAVKNNVFGLLQLLEIAEAGGCPSFVLISTDKAVNPINIMGATKRIGERMISCRPAGCMRCLSVRFGNVLGSNGSVVRVLQEQLRDHRPLTITHPDVTRFFMTTHEAVSLVLQALVIGKHGDTLLLEMGSPVRILDLAKKLIWLSGRTAREVDVCFTGLRDGEKLHEELSYAHEEILPTASQKIGRIRGTPYGWTELNCQLRELRECISGNSDAAIRDKVKEIAPGYPPERATQAKKPTPFPVHPTSKTAEPRVFQPTLAAKHSLIPDS